MNDVTFEFLRTVYDAGIAPNYLLVWTLTGDRKRSNWLISIERAAEFVETATATEHNVYFGLGLSPQDFGPSERCKSNQVTVLPGIPFDFDVYSKGVHEKEGLPPTIEEARRIVPEQYPPSIVWNTGHGIQGLYLFKEPWHLDSQDERERAAALFQRWHKYLAREATRLGYVIDSVHDHARVLRLPGTINKKLPNDPRPVEIIESSGRSYDWTDLEQILDTLGVPEIEVRGYDEQGHAEYGNLHLTPRCELSTELRAKLDALLVNDEEFRRRWERKKHMPKDNTWSGHAMSIIDRLAEADLIGKQNGNPGISDQDIIDLMSFHRRHFGGNGKHKPKTLSWFTEYTIPKARKAADDNQRRAQEREAKQKVSERQESEERVLIAEVCTGELEAQEVLNRVLELSIRRVVQIGNDVEPAYQIELQDGRTVQIPSLAAMTSFAAFNRYVWRYLRTALPAKARKHWRTVSIALGKLMVVEDTGLGRVELMLNDLGEYFSRAHNDMFEKFPAEKFPNGPPDAQAAWPFTGLQGSLVRAESEAEYLAAVSLLALPQRNRLSIGGVYYPKKIDADGAEAARVIFKGPPLYDWLRTRKERKFEIDEMNRRLVAAGFKFRDTAKEQGIRLRRVWRGELADATVDDHQAVCMDEFMLNAGVSVQ